MIAKQRPVRLGLYDAQLCGVDLTELTQLREAKKSGRPDPQAPDETGAALDRVLGIGLVVNIAQIPAFVEPVTSGCYLI